MSGPGPRSRRSLLAAGAGLVTGTVGCLDAFDAPVGRRADAVDLEVVDVSGPRSREQFEPLVERTAERLGVEVELTYSEIPYADVKRSLTTRAAGGDPPDVAAIDQIWLGEFADSGSLLPLATVEARLDLDAFLDPLADAARVGGVPYGVPTTTDVRGCYWNRAMFADAGFDPDSGPTTWAEFLEMARTLHDPPARYGAAYLVNGGRWSVTLFGAGGSVLDGTTPRFHEAPGVRAGEFLDAVYNDVAVSSPEPTYRNGAHLARSFLQGTYAMTVVEGSWLDYYWRNLDEDGSMVDRFGFGPTPHPADGAPATMSGGHLLAGFDATDHPEFVREFLAGAAAEEFNRRLAVGAGKLPTHAALLDHPDVWDAIEYPDAVRSLLDVARTRPARHWSVVADELDPALQSIAYDREPAERALADAAGAVRRRLEDA